MSKLTLEQESKIQQAYGIYEDQLFRLSKEHREAMDSYKRSLKETLAIIRANKKERGENELH